MGYFPFYIDIKDKNCLIIGGGKVALRKAEKLLGFEPNITVVSPNVCDELISNNNIKIISRRFSFCDLDGMYMVICATNDKTLNKAVYSECRKRGIHVNSVDEKEHCSFIFPALAVSKNVTIGISTSGKSPLYSRYLREKSEELIAGNCDELIDALYDFRDYVKRSIDDEEVRKKTFERLLQMGLSGRIPTFEDVEEITEDLKNNEN